MVRIVKVFCHRWFMSQMIRDKRRDRVIKLKQGTTGGRYLADVNQSKLLIIDILETFTLDEIQAA